MSESLFFHPSFGFLLSCLPRPAGRLGSSSKGMVNFSAPLLGHETRIRYSIFTHIAICHGKGTPTINPALMAGKIVACVLDKHQF
jgi:hypothetical protein